MARASTTLIITIEPAAVLPVQIELRRSKSEASGVAKLMLAVLEEGVRALLRSRSARVREEALRWAVTKDASQMATLFSFDTVCTALDINPSYLRRGLIRLFDRPQRDPVTIRIRGNVRNKNAHRVVSTKKPSR